MSNDQEKPEIQEARADSEPVEEVVEQAGETIATGEGEAIPEAAEQPEPTVDELQKQLAAAEKKATENWDKMLRMQAEMENIRRRTRIDLENAHKFALENFAKELLTVMDSLELGIQAANGDSPEVVKLREGSELTKKQFEAVFEKFNIEAIDPVGQPFDPEKHQAMSMMPSADVEPNTVLNVFQKGYLLNDRLIRPAMVVVAKAEDKPRGDSAKIDEQA